MSLSPKFDPCAESADPDLVRIYNCSITALNILYESAAAGSGAAREKLHQVADSLVQAAGRYNSEILKRCRD